MFRITTQTEGDGTLVLALEGWLLKESLPALREALTDAAEPGRAISLDLRHLTYVDQRSIDALVSLRRQGVSLVGASDVLRARLDD